VNGVVGLWARPLPLLLGAGVLLVAAPARATGSNRTYSLAYAAPEGCPARSDVLSAIGMRAPEATPSDDDAELALDVRIVPAGELASGTFSVRFRSGERFAREVPAARCEDVTTSMAIMAGLLLRGALLPEAPPAPNEPAPEAAVLAVAPAAVPIAEEPKLPPPPASSGSGASSEASGTLRFRAGVFADGRLDFAVAPFPAFGVGVGLDALLESDSWFSPGMRVGVLYATGSASEPPFGGARLSLRAVTVRACPFRLPLGAPFTLYACGLFEGGELTASPRSTPGAEGDVAMPWLGLGGAGRVEVTVEPTLALEAELSAFGLLHHDEFVVQPGDVNVYTVPAFSGAFSLGVVARWP
jgi:hypothetical protein